MGSYTATSKTAYLTLQVKRKTTREWAAYTTALKQGEPGLDTDTGEVRFGDGTNMWANLTSRCQLADKFSTSRTINGFTFDGTASVSDYVVCDTAAATGAKRVTLTGFNRVAGAHLRIKFTNGNTASSPTLQVGSTSAASIRYNNTAANTVLNNSDRIYDLTFDGTYYQLTGSYVSTTVDPTGTADQQVTNALVMNNQGQIEVPIIMSISDVDTSIDTLGDRYLQLVRNGSTPRVLSRVSISELFKNTFLSNVEYVPATHSLIFTWNTDSGKNRITIDLSDLVDPIPVYTAGDGLTVENYEFRVNAAHSTTGQRDYGVSVDGQNQLYVDVPWIDTTVTNGNDGVVVGYTAADPSNSDYINNVTVSHVTTSTASFTPGIYNNSTTKTSTSATITANGFYITVPYITRNAYGHIGTLESRNFKIVIDDGELQ